MSQEEKYKLALFAVIRNSTVMPQGVKLGKTMHEINTMSGLIPVWSIRRPKIICLIWKNGMTYGFSGKGQFCQSPCLPGNTGSHLLINVSRTIWNVCKDMDFNGKMNLTIF